MNPDNQQKLLDACPRLYASVTHPSFFSCGDGWFQLLMDLSLRIEAEIVRLDCTDTHFGQVKEKLAGLRFYAYGQVMKSPAVQAAIAEAEYQSEATCDECGRPGELYGTKYWLYTRCAKHDVNWRGEKLMRRASS